jgi:hypothetical protein
MKTKSIIIAVISLVAIATLSFTYKGAKATDTSVKSQQVDSAPLGGFAIEE